MTKKLKLSLTLMVSFLFCLLFAVISSAETYTVNYCDIGGGQKTSATTNEDGTITLRDTSVTTNTSKVFYGWFTDDGTFYASGTTLTLTEDIKLREAFAFVVTGEMLFADDGDPKNDVLDFKYYTNNYNWSLVRLDADITISSTQGIWEGGSGARSYIDLNGHTITNTGTGAVLSSTRRGFHFLNSSENEGKIISNNLKEGEGIVAISSHGYSGGQHLSLSIGKNVTVETNGALFKVNNSYNVSGGKYCPYIEIYGTVIANSIVNQNKQYTYLAEINIHSSADVTLTGATWWKNLYSTLELSFADLTIEDGAKITTNQDFNWIPSAEYIQFVEYKVTGGSFNAVLQDGVLKNGYECIYNDETGYYDVEFVACTTEGSEGTHNFVAKESYEGVVSTCTGVGVYYFRCDCGKYYIDAVDAIGHDYSVLVSETPATCTAKAYKTYKCIRCDSTQNVEYGEALGHDYSTITIEKTATLTENGVKRFTCTRCADTYTIEYSFDPSEQQISIVVKSGEGTKTIVVRAGDLYNVDGNSLKGIKSIADPDNAEVTYAVTDLVEIAIPAGFTDLPDSAISGATALQKIILLDGANITFATGSIKNCSALTTIVVGEATVSFNSNTLSSCSAFTTLNLEKANATFALNAFINSSIQHLKLGSGKTYSFGENSFKNSKLTEMIFPDNSNITFPAVAAFYGCPQLKYVYFGTGTGVEATINNVTYSSAIMNKPFDCCYAIEKIVLMDIDYINEWTFCVNGHANSNGSHKERVPEGVAVYHHGSSIALHKDAFGNRTVYGVRFYTTASVTSLNCAYTIYNGIPHAYTAVTEEVAPTCTTAGSKASGFVTDCPCGVLTDTPEYTIYSTLNTSIHETTGSISISNTIIPANGHDFDVASGATVFATTDATCLKNGTITYKCANCDETQTVDDETKPATGHDIEGLDYTVSVEAGCTTQGLKVKNCKNCYVTIESEVISATGHSVEGVEWTKISDPTCILAGTEVKYCITCGDVESTQQIVALGHTEGEWTLVLSPDCDDTGLKEQKCIRCEALIATEVIDILGHDYEIGNGAVIVGISYPNGFGSNGQWSIDCTRCTIIGDFEIAPLFVAKGYSTNREHDELNGGFTVDTYLLDLYEQLNGRITYGIVIANAGSFGENSFFDQNNKLAGSGVQVPIYAKDYTNFDCSISGFGANSSTLELIITAYVIDENGSASFIQSDSDYALEATVADKTFTKVTLDLVVANVVGEQPDALLPDEEE